SQTPSDSRSINVVPNLLGQICREWREIALTTPALWRAISLSLRRSERIQQKLRLLEISLERSGCCPLSISLNMGHHNDNQGTLDPFLRTIARHCARWEHLKLYSPVHPFPSIEGPLPLLRTLLMGGIKDEEHSSVLIPVFHAAPRLRKVALSFFKQYIYLFPMVPINCVILALSSPARSGGYFDPGANLSTAICTLRPGGAMILGPVLTGDIADPSWGFIDTFTLPALQKLQITETILQHGPATIASLISRSECSLQELYITQSSIPHSQYSIALESYAGLLFLNRSLNATDPFSVRPEEEEDIELPVHWTPHVTSLGTESDEDAESNDSGDDNECNTNTDSDDDSEGNEEGGSEGASD
ncbi:hypothetical protein B0H13DRAFT_2488038, partial [Mycena leptocephala]